MFCQQRLCEFSSLPVIYRWTLLPRISCYSCSKDDWWWQRQPGTDSTRHFTRSCPYYRCCAPPYRLCCIRTSELIKRHHVWNLLHYIYGTGGKLFSTIKTTMIKSLILALLLDHKDCILSCQWENVVILSFTYSLLYCSPFFGGKKSFY